MTDTTDAALDALWDKYCEAASPNGNMDDIDLYDIDGMFEAAHAMRDAITALRAERDAAYARGVHVGREEAVVILVNAAKAIRAGEDDALTWGGPDPRGSNARLFELQRAKSFDQFADAIRALADAPPALTSDKDADFDNDAVYQFSRLMREKMTKSRAKGRSGWHDPTKCSPDYLRSLLYEHIYKGDPVDVANLCMMLRHYQENTTPRPEDDLRLADAPPAPVVGVTEVSVLKAAGEEYTLDHPLETSEERMGRHSAVRGMMARLGLYPELEAAIDAALLPQAGGGEG